MSDLNVIEMKEPRKPQDRKPKAGTITVQGITLSIPEDRVSDWDVVEGVATLQDDATDQPAKLVASVRVMRRILGGDYERVKRELRSAHDGRLDAEHMSLFLKEVFEGLNPNS